MNNVNREEIMKVYQTHLKNLMDLEDGENEIRKKKLQGGFLPMLLPMASLLGNLLGKGHTNHHEQNKEGYARDEGVVNVMKRKRGRPVKQPIQGSGIISDLGIPGVSQVAGLFGLGKTGAGQTGAGTVAVAKPKKTSAWIEFVKKYSKQKGIPYKQALSEAKPHYKK